LSLRTSLRLAAAVLLIALAISATVLFLVTHSAVTYVPVNPNAKPNHALAGGRGGMVSPSTGWGLGGGGIIRTTDGGVHWTDVTPPSNAGPVYFLDATHAWLFPYRTTDGGKTWQMGESIGSSAGSGGLLYFHDANHGWLWSVTNQGDGLFATDDGGLRWARLATNPFATPCGPLPLGSGGDSRRMAFVSVSDGWIARHCGASVGASGGMLLATHDGGTTWSPQQLPTGTAVPVAINDQNAVIFSAGMFRGDNPALLVTSDAGRTWAARRVPVGVDTIHFIDPLHGWASVTLANPNGLTPSMRGETVPLYRTDNGGVTWSRVATNLQRDVPATIDTLAGPHVYDNLIEDLYFVDLNNGFAVRGGAFPLPTFCTPKHPTDPPQHCAASAQLLKTSDGGVTWTVVGFLP
jgi:photosystem II stability/assembly factor-like uncharacterized protein